MQQSLPDESLILTTASPARLLHPTLRRALGVLDARLDDELARYRRYRKGMKIAPSSVTALQRSMATVAAPALRLPTPSPTVAAPAIAPTVATEDITVNQTPAPPLPPRTPHSFQNELPVGATSALVVAAAQADTPNAAEPLIRPEDLPQYGFVTDDRFATDATAPNDYLESSEELLRSLAVEEATVAAERHVLEGLLTPFGVGSMLLMLLGSGMFGYLIMNPASLNAVKDLAMQVARFRSPASGPTTVAAVDVDGSGTGNTAWMSNSPALDANEFMNLSLGNISALRTRPGGLTLMPPPNAQGGAPLQQLNNKPQPNAATGKGTKNSGGTKGITSFTPLNIKPIAPPAPVIAAQGGGSGGNGLFSGAPVRIAPAPSRPARSYAPSDTEPAPSRPARSYEPAPRYVAPEPRYEAPAPRYEAPAPRYVAPEPRYEAPPETVKVLPPPPTPLASPSPEAAPQPQGDYRVVTPYTNDADLETAQKANPNASFRNMDDGAYVQHDAYSSKAEADAKAVELQQQGISAEVK
jgi:hypothetical protein